MRNMIDMNLKENLAPMSTAMTTALACMKNGRQKFCIEENKECFRYAIARIRVHAFPKSTMQHLPDYDVFWDSEKISPDPTNADDSIRIPDSPPTDASGNSPFP